MSTATLRANVNTKPARRHRFRSWLRVNVLENRVTPTVHYPDMVDVPEPQSSYTFPTSGSLPFTEFNPPVNTSTPSALAPQLAEWTRIAQPDHSLAVTGHLLSSFQGTEAGKDTEFIVYGQTTSTEPEVAFASTLRIDGPRAAVTLPNSKQLEPDSTYFMWPRNADSVGRPVRINAPAITWIGPNLASANETVTIYGTNLARQGITTQDTWVYIETAGGTAISQPWINVTASEANPYAVTFKLPSGLTPSTTYHLRIHTGLGEEYGFSNEVELQIRDPLPGPDPYVIDFDVVEYGATVTISTDDDSVGINKAIKAADDYVTDTGNAATVFFPAGTYHIAKTLVDNENIGIHNITYKGVLDSGVPVSIIQPLTTLNSIFYAENSIPSNIHFKNLKFDNNGLVSGGAYKLVAVRGGYDISFDNVHFVADAFNLTPIDVTGSNRVTIQGCDFETGGFVVLDSAKQVRVDDCAFSGKHFVPFMMRFQYSGEVSVTNCKAMDFDSKGSSVADFALGRFIWAQGGFNENFYIYKNTTIDLAPPWSLIDSVPNDPENDYLNAGETIDFETFGPAYYGSPSAAGANAITFADLEVDYLASNGRLTASIIDGKGLGQRRKVTDINTTTGVVTVEPAWNVVPDSTSIISLAPTQQNVVIYDNDLDGKEEWMTDSDFLGTSTTDFGVQVASGALTIYGVAHFVIVNNCITDMRHGVNMIPSRRDTTGTTSNDPRPQFDNDFFNYIADNHITNSAKGIDMTAAPDQFAVGFAAVGYGSAHLGTTIRNNTFAQMKRFFSENKAYHTFVIGTELSHQYRAADLTIIEANDYLATAETEVNGLVGIGMYGVFSPSIFDTVIRDNEFTALNSTSKGLDFALGGTPALFGNKWGSATKYAGSFKPGPVLELPQRVVPVEWTGTAVPLTVTVRNAGTANLWFSGASDSSWLTVSPYGLKIAAEAANTLTMAADLTGLGQGTYTATVTVTSGTLTQSFTVVATVASGDYGPHAGILPNLRHDQVVTIEAEHYDRGGNNVGFYDPDGDDHVLGQAIVMPPAHDWYNYTVNVPDDGWYRVEARVRANGADEEIQLFYGQTVAHFYASNSANWESIRADNNGIEDFVYLSYGVQTLKMKIKSTIGPDIDWIRFLSVDDNKVGIPLPYLEVAPTLSEFHYTYLQTEHYDNGGIGVAYSDNWDAGAVTTSRDDEQVNIQHFTNPFINAVLGAEDQWLHYAIDVARPGTYRVDFRVSTAAANGTIRLQTPDEETLFSNMVDDEILPSTSGVFATVTRLVTFDSAGPKTIQLKFQDNAASSSVTGYVDWIRFEPANLMLVGPEQFPTETINTGSKTHVGTVFAVNAPGDISTLRFYQSLAESTASAGAHTLRLWKINETATDGTIVDADELTFQAITATGKGWREAQLTTAVSLDPGLYMVSVDVHASTLSIAEIYDVVPPATPSVLTLVAGSFSDTASTFPDKVYHDSNYPTAYFWLDVSFTPMY